MSSALIASTTGLYELNNVIDDPKNLYLGIGSFVILAAFFLIYGINDIVNKDKKSKVEENG